MISIYRERNMKYLLSSIMVLSLGATSFINAEEGPVYEPNVAEYYVSSFKENKDMDDMMKWAEKWKKWATTGDAIEPNAD